MDSSKIRAEHDTFIANLPRSSPITEPSRCYNLYWNILRQFKTPTGIFETSTGNKWATTLFGEIMQTARCDNVAVNRDLRLSLVERILKIDEDALTKLAEHEDTPRDQLGFTRVMKEEQAKIIKALSTSLPPSHRLYYHTLYKLEGFYFKLGLDIGFK